MHELKTRFVGIELSHPVMNASGILGSEPEHIEILVGMGFAAVVTKTITSYPRRGNPMPIVIELPTGGLLNAVGLENPGKDAIPSLVSRARSLGIPIIVSVGGTNPKEFAEVVEVCEKCSANAVELNLSCPHARGYGLEIGADPHNVKEVVRECVAVTRLPVIAKLGLCDRVVECAEKALEAGAKGLTLINTVKAMVIDVYTAKPILSNVFGGLSGPPIHPIAVRVVYEVYRELRAEIAGCGGVYDWKTAAELILAGAKVVQIGSAIYSDRGVVRKVLQGLRRWLQMLSLRSIEEAVGLAHKL